MYALHFLTHVCSFACVIFLDPDIWANVTILVGASYYMAYNALLFRENYENYDTLYIFVDGDYWYFANSMVYLLGCSLRDSGLYFFLPTGGIWPKYTDADELSQIENEDHGLSSAMTINKVEHIETDVPASDNPTLAYGTFRN